MKYYARNTSVDSVCDSSDSEMSCDEGMQEIADSLYQALKEDRLVQGVFPCARILEQTPEVVTLCAIPEEQCKNISAHIQQKLIEAFCWENDIRVINVEESTLQNLAKQSKSKSDSKSVDFYCVLVTSSSDEHSQIDEQTETTADNFG
ncbi:GA45B-like protein [Mya arenaria]|uniref:GA45B-like protein n=1 Tax=Mya arenaria TaxID=6604 RepID=A0ABY7FR74_MYAAR|nr:growth arrest and DNA damage-inducible protein GADD45 beta-like [Mya arenaria]WAR24718.1 GA45B-like protein [Mya arenaria]